MPLIALGPANSLSAFISRLIILIYINCFTAISSVFKDSKNKVPGVIVLQSVKLAMIIKEKNIARET
jgi:Fe2+ transport system protein B